MLTRWIRDRVDVGAGDVERRAVRLERLLGPERRLRDHHGVVRVRALQLLVAANQPVGGRRTVRIAGLVDAFPHAERRMRLQSVDDPDQQLLVRRRRRRRRRQVRNGAELEPARQLVCRRRIQNGLLGRDLRVDLWKAPLHRSRANEVDAGARDLAPRVGARRSRPAGRRPLGERDGEDLPAADHQAAGRSVNGDGGHPGIDSSAAVPPRYSSSSRS